MEWKIPLFKIHSDEEDVKAVSKVIERGTYWAAGPEIEQFEKAIAGYVDVKYALCFNSGTSALLISLMAHDVVGKEVIVPSFTFIATASAVALAGATPVFAETESDTLGLDVSDVEKRITNQTCAIIPLHYGGFPSRDIEDLQKLAKKHNLAIIEDSAESLGSNINGKKVGAFGDSAIFSFCQNKVLTTGEGGVIVTNSQEIYEKAKLIRSHGRIELQEDYFNSIGDNKYMLFGYNLRMPSICAALGLSQLAKVQKIIDLRRKHAAYLTSHLEKMPQIITPKNLKNHYQVYQMYTIQLPNKKTRDTLQEYLAKKGIMSKVYFNCLHLMDLFKEKYGYKKGSLPKTEHLSDCVLNIPLFPSIKKEELDYMISSIKEGIYNEH